MTKNADVIRNQVMWDRLIAVVEDQARTLIRTAFSTAAREAGDISAGVFSRQGDMLAQAVTGTPGHVNAMARSVGHFLKEFPLDTMKPGDSYITNDPWRGTGHLFDITVVSPVFRGGRVVALFACTTHVVDVGGNGPTPDSRDVFSEGLFLPLLKICDQGRMEETIIRIIRANVREPDQLMGDVYALVACNEAGASRLLAMMDEYGLETLDALERFIFQASDASMVKAIRSLPQGTWKNVMRIDGYEAPVDLVATLTVKEDMIHVDYSGTSGVSQRGINCPMCHTEAYTSFGVKCVVAPFIPNNAATLARIVVTAPENSITNAPFPSPVTARAIIGQMLPDVVFGCFAQALPDRVPAESTGSLWNLFLAGGPGISGAGQSQTSFSLTMFHSGGMGARPGLDGVSATPFPAGVKAVPIEISEAISPIVVWRKELRTDSGGDGRYRGGLGQTLEIGNRENAPFAIFARFERVDHPARGRHEGTAGAGGRVSLKSGTPLKPKGTQIIPAGDRLVVEMPGGGGQGLAKEREAAAVRRDLDWGYISAEKARHVYGMG